MALSELNFWLTTPVAPIAKKCGIWYLAVISICATATELCQPRMPAMIFWLAMACSYAAAPLAGSDWSSM